MPPSISRFELKKMESIQFRTCNSCRLFLYVRAPQIGFNGDFQHYGTNVQVTIAV